MNKSLLLQKAKQGFKTLEVADKFKASALSFIDQWFTFKEFSAYRPQIQFLIESEKWSVLLDSFYQIIPFGTGGRRGPVGIGPNRINAWTIMTSAQGHSQYLVKLHGQKIKKQGVVLAYDVRQYFDKGIYSAKLPNPVAGLTCKSLAIDAARVYAANGIKVYLFDNIRSTPELSFAIRYLKAIAGDMFSASHNPPADNGKKVYDRHGGQLIPPDDQKLLDEVTQKVKKIKIIDFQKALHDGQIVYLGQKVDRAYLKQVQRLSLSANRAAKIVYSPFHGTGISSVYPVLKESGFKVQLDPKTANLSGSFENITFNIPNPEVEQSFIIPLKFARKANADILLASDPDADRIGIMVNLGTNRWRYLNGNEIGIILCQYAISKAKSSGDFNSKKTIIKTMVTTSLIEKIAQKNGIRCVSDLLVGYKYIGAEMNKMEKRGEIKDFLFGVEESHGYIAGNYLRDKDAALAALWLAELSGELKEKGENLVDYLAKIYSEYGYCRNYLTEIRIPGAAGQARIEKIQQLLRQKPPKKFENYQVINFTDKWSGTKHLSATDTQSRNVLVFQLKGNGLVKEAKVTIRPSGTEPKIKMYFEIRTDPFPAKNFSRIKALAEEALRGVEKSFLKYCYRLINVDFPDRGFLLFWQLPLDIKLKYFDIEPEIANLRSLPQQAERKKKLNAMLSFLGSDPIQKIDQAFMAKYKQPLVKYLRL